MSLYDICLKKDEGPFLYTASGERVIPITSLGKFEDKLIAMLDSNSTVYINAPRSKFVFEKEVNNPLFLLGILPYTGKNLKVETPEGREGIIYVDKVKVIFDEFNKGIFVPGGYDFYEFSLGVRTEYRTIQGTPGNTRDVGYVFKEKSGVYRFFPFKEMREIGNEELDIDGRIREELEDIPGITVVHVKPSNNGKKDEEATSVFGRRK